MPKLLSPLHSSSSLIESLGFLLFLRDLTIIFEKISNRGHSIEDNEVFGDPSCSREKVSKQAKLSITRLEQNRAPMLDLHHLFCRFLWLLVAVVFYLLDSICFDLDY